jgi:hypothetical protein
VYPQANLVDFFPNVVTLAFERFQSAEVLLNFFQFSGYRRAVGIAIARRPACLNHGKQQLSAGKHRANIR